MYSLNQNEQWLVARDGAQGLRGPAAQRRVILAREIEDAVVQTIELASRRLYL